MKFFQWKNFILTVFLLKNRQEKALDSGPETGWITYHQLKMIARRIFSFRTHGQITYYTKLLMGMARSMLQYHTEAKKWFTQTTTLPASLDSATYPEADFGSDRDDLFQSPVDLGRLRIDVLSVVEYLHSGLPGIEISPTDREAFYRSPYTKMLLNRREWNLLSRYYPAEIIGQGMSGDAFLKLYETLITAPVDLCFASRYNLQLSYDLMAEVEDDQEVYLQRKLPELTSSNLVDLCRVIGDNHPTALTCLTAYNLALVCVYQALKDGYSSDNHTYLHLRQLRSSAVKYVLEHKEITNSHVHGIVSAGVDDNWWSQLLASLVKDNVIVVHQEEPPKPSSSRIIHSGSTRIYLYSKWAEEEIIGQALAHTTQNAARLQTAIKKPLPEFAQLRTNAGHALCDEQIEAMSSICNKAVTIISGRAGSGKSDLLQTINRLVERDAAKEEELFIHLQRILNPRKSMDAITKEAKKWVEEGSGSLTILGTSAQGNNVSDLARLLGAGAASFTMHSLFLKHHRNCPNYGFKQMSNNKVSTSVGGEASSVVENKCLFHGIKILIVEEGSLATPENLSKLLGLLALCAPELQRILIVGDSNQCAAVSGGKVICPRTII